MRTLMRKTKQKHSEKLINTHTHTNQATRNKVKKKKSLAHTHTHTVNLAEPLECGSRHKLFKKLFR